MMPLVEKWVTVMGMALYLGVTCVIASEAGTDDLHIAAFNVQVFGRTKMSKPEVVDTLVKVSYCWDIPIGIPVYGVIYHNVLYRTTTGTNRQANL